MLLALGIAGVAIGGMADVGFDHGSRMSSVTTASPVPAFDHIFTVLMENHSYGNIIGSSQAPYINSLANQYGLATNYQALTHPSLPNYLGLTGGSTLGLNSNCAPGPGCSSPGANIADRVEGSGRTWRGYLEGMTQPCMTADSGAYIVHHDPFVYYDDIRTNAPRCTAGVVPFTRLASDLSSQATTPNYVWITPTNQHNMHDGSIANGDAWLKGMVSQIQSSAAYTLQNSLIVIVWDEGDAGSNQVAALFVNPSIQGVRSATRYDHYSLLRTVETAWGLPSAGAGDGAATAMTDMFAPAATPTPTATPTSTTTATSTPTPTATPTSTPTATPAPTPTPTPVPGPQMVQSASSASTSVSLAAPSRAGDLLVLGAAVNTGVSRPILSVSDGSNSWTRAGAYAVSGQYSDGELWYVSGAAPMSTLTVNTGAGPVALQLMEFSGVIGQGALDIAGGSATRGSAMSSGTVTPGSSGDLAVGFAAPHGGTQPITVTSSGYTLLTQQDSGSGSSALSLVSGFQQWAGGGAQAFNASVGSSAYWSAGLALFRVSAAPPPPTPTPTPTPAPTPTPSPMPGSISGTVTASGGGVISGASVSDGVDPPATTSAGGAYTIPNVAPGTYTVTAGATGYAPAHTGVMLSSGQAMTQVDLVLSPAATVPRLVQSAGSTSSSITLPSPAAAGDLLVLAAGLSTGTSQPISSVSGGSNTWTRIGAYATSGHNSDGELWSTIATSTVSSVNVQTGAASVTLQLMEFSGVSRTTPFDTGTGTSSSGGPASSGTATTGIGGELIVGFVAGHGNAQQMTPTANGFAVFPQQTSGGTVASLLTGWSVAGSAGTESFGASFGSSMWWAAGVACFRSAT